MNFLLSLVIILVIIVSYKLASLTYFRRKSNVYNSLIFLPILLFLSLTYFDLSLQDIGLSINGSGVAYGAVASAGLLIVLLIGGKLKLTRQSFIDSRTTHLSRRQILRKAILEIPFGTVLTEEVIFRGIIFAVIMQVSSEVSAIIYSSLAFGLWHIVDSIIFFHNNKVLGGKTKTALVTVGFTTLAGIVFATLRVFSGSLLAPILLHVTANSGALIVSWMSENRSGGH